MEIIQERLEREYGLDLVATAPSVEHHVLKTNGAKLIVSNPSDLPAETEIAEISEPWMALSVFTPAEYIGQVMELTTKRRGIFQSMEYLDPSRVLIAFHIPLIEILVDYFDKLKSSTRGYASMDYTFLRYDPADLVRLDVLVNEQPVDALSIIVHRDQAYLKGQRLVSRLKNVIPRQQFQVPIQAVIGKKVISRANVKAVRKDVLAKCYGGDVTRKRKLLERQKAGKKRLKQIGRVLIPQDAFMAVLRLEDD
jgi:GTP-binding protein LepA